MAKAIDWKRIKKWEDELRGFKLNKHTDLHWKVEINNCIIDLWPSTRKFSINGTKSRLMSSVENLIKVCMDHKGSSVDLNERRRKVGGFLHEPKRNQRDPESQIRCGLFYKEDDADDDPVFQVNTFFMDNPDADYVDAKIKYDMRAGTEGIDHIHSIMLFYSVKRK